MKVVHCFILISVIQPQSHCYGNNVCKTIQDYYTIKDNPNCEYNVAADPDADPITIIEYYGYPAEIHKVTTLDGYILTMFRIPNNQVASKKGPVLLQHGWFNSAATYLGLGNQSLALLLADAGYDVWLANHRGSEYSEEHISLTVYNEEYWDYSIDEIGLFDVPAELDYISQATGNKGDIIYIGYSLGCSVGVIYSSTFPEEARKTLKLLILLAPATSMPNLISPLYRYPRAFLRPLYQFAVKNDLIRLTSQTKVMKSLSREICLESPALLERCGLLTNLVFAGPQSQTDPKTLPVVINQNPAGSSLKILSQIGDWLLGNFRRYDYGIKNVEVYGSNEPPPFEVRRIQVPVFLAHAINDWAVTPPDARRFYNELSPKVKYGRYEIQVPNFNHADFMYGRNTKSILYNVLLEIMHQT